MMSEKPLVDQKCFDLAEAWLADDCVTDLTPKQMEARYWSLAAAIQQAIEDWEANEERSTGIER